MYLNTNFLSITLIVLYQCLTICNSQIAVPKKKKPYNNDCSLWASERDTLRMPTAFENSDVICPDRNGRVNVKHDSNFKLSCESGKFVAPAALKTAGEISVKCKNGDTLEYQGRPYAFSEFKCDTKPKVAKEKCAIPKSSDGSDKSTGSEEPPLVEGSLRFYSMRYCPYAHRVQLVLNAKNIKHDTVFINLSDKPEWFLKKFPSGKVPALIFEDKCLTESLVISDFLDEQYVWTPPILINNPLMRCLDRMFIESFGKVSSAFYKLMMTTEKLEKDNFNELVASLSPIEAELDRRGGDYYGGYVPKMVDYMIWPWFERLDAIKPFTNGELAIPWDKFPKLAKWKTSMISDKAVAPYYATPEQHAKHFSNRKAGLPSYDI